MTPNTAPCCITEVYADILMRPCKERTKLTHSKRSLVCQRVSFLIQLNGFLGSVLCRGPSEPSGILYIAFWFLVRRHVCVILLLLLLFTAVEFSLYGSSPYTSNK